MKPLLVALAGLLLAVPLTGATALQPADEAQPPLVRVVSEHLEYVELLYITCYPGRQIEVWETWDRHTVQQWDGTQYQDVAAVETSGRDVIEYEYACEATD